MALSIRKENFIKYAYDSGAEKMAVCAEIDVDTADELPEIDGISGRILHQGSTALIIKEGRLAVLSGDGKWYGVSGEIVKE